MSDLNMAVEIMTDIKDMLEADDMMCRAEMESADNGMYRCLYIGAGDKVARIKIGEGSLKNFR